MKSYRKKTSLKKTVKLCIYCGNIVFEPIYTGGHKEYVCTKCGGNIYVVCPESSIEHTKKSLRFLEAKQIIAEKQKLKGEEIGFDDDIGPLLLHRN